MKNIIDIARYFLSLDEHLTNKQIQKLVYYAYCWYIVKNNKDSANINDRLFYDRPEAWVHGPVFPNLYREMTYHRNDFLKGEDYKKLDNETTILLDLIYKVYGKYSGNQLESLTHQEAPWKEAVRGKEKCEKINERIDDKIIFEYYNS